MPPRWQTRAAVHSRSGRRNWRARRSSSRRKSGASNASWRRLRIRMRTRWPGSFQGLSPGTTRTTTDPRPARHAPYPGACFRILKSASASPPWSASREPVLRTALGAGFGDDAAPFWTMAHCPWRRGIVSIGSPLSADDGTSSREMRASLATMEHRLRRQAVVGGDGANPGKMSHLWLRRSIVPRGATIPGDEGSSSREARLLRQRCRVVRFRWHTSGDNGPLSRGARFLQQRCRVVCFYGAPPAAAEHCLQRMELRPRK